MDKSYLALLLIIVCFVIFIVNMKKIFSNKRNGNFFLKIFSYITSLHGPGENKNRSGLSYKGIEILLQNDFSAGKIGKLELQNYLQILDSAKELQPEKDLDYTLRDDLISGEILDPVLCDTCKGIMEPLYNGSKICRNCHFFIDNNYM